jgi:hypothetical protein
MKNEEPDSYRSTPSILASLQCLPEVVESDSDASWKMFLALQSDEGPAFAPTQPSDLRAPTASHPGVPPRLTVQDVMMEARRHNRVAPCERRWQQMHLLLEAAGRGTPPPPMAGLEGSTTPPLVKRIRVRDQVEWAAEHGLLEQVAQFFTSLPEDQWVHMGR